MELVRACALTIILNWFLMMRDEIGSISRMIAFCEKCSGICLKVCPGVEVDMDQLNRQVFGKLPDDYWAGNTIQAFLGYSPDEMVKKTSASGGIVSTLIIHAIETGMIQGLTS